MSMNRIFFKRMLRKYRHEHGVHGPKPLFKKPDSSLSKAINKSIYGTSNNTDIESNKPEQEDNNRQKFIEQQVKDDLANYYYEQDLDEQDDFSIVKLGRNFGLYLLGFILVATYAAKTNKDEMWFVCYLILGEMFFIIKAITSNITNKRLWKWSAIICPVGMIFLLIGFVSMIDLIRTR